MKKNVFILIFGLLFLMACNQAAMVDPTTPFPEGPSGNTGGDNGGDNGGTTSPVGSLVTMKDVHGGSFSMGILAEDLPNANYHEGDEAPVRTVTVSDFIMGETEVTQAQWHTVMGADKMPNSDGSTVPSFSTGKGDNYPAYNISWYDAIRFCNGLSAREGLEAVYTLGDGTDLKATTTRTAIEAAGIVYDNSKNGYRLPTEAEWEYAAGGGAIGAERTLFAGTSETSKATIAEYAWYYSGDTEPTSTDVVKGTTPRKPNQLGLYDMSGNVAEWCWDEYAAYTGDNLTNPVVGTYTGGTDSERVYRGGWYNEGWDESLIHMRYSEVTRVRSSYLSRIGFRVVRTVELEGDGNTGGETDTVITMADITLAAVDTPVATSGVKMAEITIGASFADVPLTISAGEIAFADADNTFALKKTALEAQITTSLSGTLPTGVELVSVTVSVSTADIATVTVKIKAKTGYKFESGFDPETVITLNTKGAFSSIFAVPVEGGSFPRANDGISDPATLATSATHTVTVDAFYMGETEVTQGQWKSVMGENSWPSKSSSKPNGLEPTDALGKGDTHPIYYVKWYDAINFCNGLSIKEGLDPVYTLADGKAITATTTHTSMANGVVANFTKSGYRLPTEAEWEYAAGGGSGTRTTLAGLNLDGAGLSALKGSIWYYASNNPTASSQPVGQLKANQLELKDMSGNILEWCWDAYVHSENIVTYAYDTNKTDNPTGPTTWNKDDRRVQRGSYWKKTAEEAQVYYRNYNSPGALDNLTTTLLGYSGFRVVRRIN